LAERCRVAARVASAAGLHRAKVIKVLTPNGKVIMRLPSTGGKVIKMITHMEMGDTFDSNDTFDDLDGWAGPGDVG
jgi:hypothetical protein